MPNVGFDTLAQAGDSSRQRMNFIQVEPMNLRRICRMSNEMASDDCTRSQVTLSSAAKMAASMEHHQASYSQHYRRMGWFNDVHITRRYAANSRCYHAKK